MHSELKTKTYILKSRKLPLHFTFIHINLQNIVKYIL
jgi:hypothetical protein